MDTKHRVVQIGPVPFVVEIARALAGLPAQVRISLRGALQEIAGCSTRTSARTSTSPQPENEDGHEHGSGAAA